MVRQLRSRAPVVDLRVLRYRSLWSGSILFAVPLLAGTRGLELDPRGFDLAVDDRRERRARGHENQQLMVARSLRSGVGAAEPC